MGGRGDSAGRLISPRAPARSYISRWARFGSFWRALFCEVAGPGGEVAGLAARDGAEGVELLGGHVEEVDGGGDGLFAFPLLELQALEGGVEVVFAFGADRAVGRTMIRRPKGIGFPGNETLVAGMEDF